MLIVISAMFFLATLGAIAQSERLLDLAPATTRTQAESALAAIDSTMLVVSDSSTLYVEGGTILGTKASSIRMDFKGARLQEVHIDIRMVETEDDARALYSTLQDYITKRYGAPIQGAPDSSSGVMTQHSWGKSHLLLLARIGTAYYVYIRALPAQAVKKRKR